MLFQTVLRLYTKVGKKGTHSVFSKPAIMLGGASATYDVYRLQYLTQHPNELLIFVKRLERLTSIELFTVLTEQYRKKK